MLYALLLAASTVAFPPDGSYTYAATMGGQPVGRWSVSVNQNGAGTELNENSNASIMGMQLSASAALQLDGSLAPTHYTGNYKTPGQNLTATVTLNGSSATVVGVLEPGPQQIGLAAGTTHFVVIEPGLLSGLFALPAQLAAWKDASVTWITPTSASAQPLTPAAQSASVRPSSIPKEDELLAIDRPIAVTIWYDPATFVPDQISVPSQNAVLTRVR